MADELRNRLHANKVLLARSTWLFELSSAIGMVVGESDVLTIAETATLIDLVASRLRDAEPVGRWSTTATGDLFARLHATGNTSIRQAVLVPIAESDRQAVRLDVATVLDHAEALLVIVHDLVLISDGAADGIVVEKNFEPEPTYEAFVWGVFEEAWRRE
jgi:hypothetical protein